MNCNLVILLIGAVLFLQIPTSVADDGYCSDLVNSFVTKFDQSVQSLDKYMQEDESSKPGAEDFTNQLNQYLKGINIDVLENYHNAFSRYIAMYNGDYFESEELKNNKNALSALAYKSGVTELFYSLDYSAIERGIFWGVNMFKGRDDYNYYEYLIRSMGNEMKDYSEYPIKLDPVKLRDLIIKKNGIVKISIGPKRIINDESGRSLSYEGIVFLDILNLVAKVESSKFVLSPQVISRRNYVLENVLKTAKECEEIAKQVR